MRFTLLTASAFAALASAQTHTDCNPMEKDCPNNPAMPKTFETNFKAGADAVKGWKQTAGKLTYGADGAQFTINKKGDAPTIQSEGYLHFGYVEVKCKAATGQGIISSIVLQSEDLDEVDWEFIGTTSTNVQMNYFGKGNTTTYDRMIEGPVASPQTTTHSYALNWTQDALTWIIDGAPVRTLKYAEAVGGKNYPQTPVTVRIGIWAGGDPDNEPGVISWAGGKTDYSKAPFTMTVESVKVINYRPGTEYKWTDKSGSYQSIQVIGEGNEGGNAVNSEVLTPSATITGGGLQSAINVPSSTLYRSGNGGAETTSCTEGEGMPATTGSPDQSYTTPVETPIETPVETPASSAGESIYPSEIPTPSTPPTGGNGSVPGETPCASCTCGVATVTVTVGGPDSVPVPSGTPLATNTPPAPPAPSSAYSQYSVNPPSVTVVPPYPISTPGLTLATGPSPTGGYPTGGLPGNGSTPTAPAPSQFSGLAVANKAHGAMLGLVAGVAMLVV